METKEHDFFSDILASPQANFSDFIAAGYTTDNSFILDYSKYRDNDWVRDHFQDEYGNFDEKKLKQAYNNTILLYNKLSDYSVDSLVEQQTAFSLYDFLVDQSKRRQQPEFFLYKVTNPLRLVYGLGELGTVEDPTLSMDEVAQSNKVLLNPTTAGVDFENALWGETPNSHFWKYFWDTLVLAQYDEDGEHLDPFSGETVQHLKGELKLNPQGEYYYEKLDGRNIYGRQVLNKGNILTVDGSKLNRYDIFDADGIEQRGFVKSLLANTVLVGSMFLGAGIGDWVIGLTLANNLVGLAGTLGKMVSSSDEPTLSALEGWGASWDRRRAKTEYAQLHPWCWESFIDLIGDFVEIPETLRFIFEKVPYIVKGGDILSKEALDARYLELLKANEDFAHIKMMLLSNLSANMFSKSKDFARTDVIKAISERQLANEVKSALNIGEIFSKGYMALSIANNTYGEAKAAGASDIDATMLTLGYTAALYGFLSLGLSKWIFPELRAESYLTKAIAKALAERDSAVEDAIKELSPKEFRLSHVLKMFNLGRSIANSDYATGAKTLSATLASGVGMGVEGMGFEFLSDLSKGCYDVVKWLLGEDNRMETFGYDFENNEWDWANTAALYGETFLSAVVGGSIANAFTTYKGLRNVNTMDKKQAVSQLVWLARNGLLLKFIDNINKMTFGDKNLSSLPIDIVDGLYVFGPGTKTDNLDITVKNRIIELARMYENILNAIGAKVSDDALIDTLTLKDLRYSVLLSSIMKDAYLNDINETERDYLLATVAYNRLLNSVTDVNKDGIPTDREIRRARTIEEKKALLDENGKKQAKELEDRMKNLRTKINDFTSGQKAYDFIKDSLFDMSEFISGTVASTSFPLYVRAYYGKDYEHLSDDLKNEAKENFKHLRETKGRDKTRLMSDIFHQMMLDLSDTLQEHADLYRRSSEAINRARSLMSSAAYKYIIQGTDLSFINTALKIESSRYGTVEEAIAWNFANDEQIKALAKNSDAFTQYIAVHGEDKSPEYKSLRKKYFDLVNDLCNLALEDDLETAFVKLGYIPTELKVLVLDYLGLVSNDIGDQIASTDDMYDIERLLKSNENITNIRKTIEGLDESPLWNNLNKFAVAINENDPTQKITISDVLKGNEETYSRLLHDISQYRLSSTDLEALESSVNLLLAYGVAIMASRMDNASASNAFGYATTLNEVARKMNLIDNGKRKMLTEIDSSISDRLLEEINVNMGKLRYLLKLNELNTGLKLATNERVRVVSSGIIYNRLRNFINGSSGAITKWNGFDELKAAINSLSLLEEIVNQKKTSLLFGLDELLELEITTYEDAVNKFFVENIDKVKDPLKLALIINGKALNLYEKPTDTFEDGMSSVSDNSIIWYLATLAALKSSTFKSRYASILGSDSNRILASIYPQEKAIYMNYASVVNGDMFTYFYNAYRLAIVNDWKLRSSNERINILKNLGYQEEFAKKLSDDKAIKYLFNVVPAPKNSNIFLAEGIAGAGKSKGILPQTLLLLRLFHPEILENIYVLHGGDKAGELVSNLGLENAQTFTILLFLLKCIADPTSILTDSLKQGSFLEDEYLVIPTVKIIKPSDNVPKLIIIDEVLRLNMGEIAALNEFAKTLGISVLAYGDFELTGIVLDINFTNEILGKDSALSLENESVDFIRIPKLGISMRTDNSLKTTNIYSIRMALSKDTNLVNLLYSIDNNGALYGDKPVGVTADTNAAEIPDVVDTIRGMVSTLQEGAKIEYICDNPKSKVKDWLIHEFGDKINVKDLSAAVGEEGQYYIIEVNGQNNKLYLKDIYTGISRATQGSLILVTGDSVPVELKGESLANKINEPRNDTQNERLSTLRRKVLLKLYPEPQSLSIINRTAEATSSEAETSSVVETPPEAAPDIAAEIVSVSAIDPTGGTASDLLDRSKAEDDTTKTEKFKLKWIEVVNGRITTVIHTNFNYSYGVKVVDGKYDPNSINKYRVDGIHGLVKLKPDIKMEEIDSTITDLLLILLETEDKGDLVRNIKRVIVGLNKSYETEDFFVNFGYKQSRLSSPENSNSCFDIYPDETINFAGPNVQKAPQNKLVAVIGTRKGIMLEMSLGTLASPMTVMASSDIYKKVRQVYNEVYNREIKSNPDDATLRGKAMYKASLAVINDPELRKNPAYKSLINLFEIYVSNKSNFTYLLDDGNGKIIGILNESELEDWKKLPNEAITKDLSTTIRERLDKSTWTPAKNTEMLGSRLIKTRGLLSYKDEFKWTANDSKEAWIPIRELALNKKFKISNHIYTATSDFKDSSGRVYLKKGNSFIFLSSAPRTINTDKEMWQNFMDFNNGAKVKRMVEVLYITPPKGTVEEYLFKLKTIYGTDAETRKLVESKYQKKDIGFIFTSYRILSSLFAPSYLDRVRDISYKHLGKEFTDKLINKIRELQIIEDTLGINAVTNALSKASDLYNGEGVAPSLLSSLNWALFHISHNKSDLTVDPTSDAVTKFLDSTQLNNEILAIIKGICKDGISYNMTKSSETLSSNIIAINTNENYLVDGNDCYVFGKVDSNVMRVDLDDFTQYMVDSSMPIEGKNGVITSPDKVHYFNNVSLYTRTYREPSESDIPESSEKDIPKNESTLDPKDVKIDGSAFNLMESDLKLTMGEEITNIDFQNENGDSISEIVKNDLGEYEFYIKVNSNRKFRVTYKEENDDTEEHLEVVEIKEENGEDVDSCEIFPIPVNS